MPTNFVNCSVFCEIMSIKQYFVAVIAALLTCLVALKIYFVSYHVDNLPLLQNGYGQLQEQTLFARECIRQRNDMSKLLNLKQQQIGQMECEKKSGQHVAASGGWCQKPSTETGGQHMTDTSLVTALATVLKGKSVASFGDGPGRYKQLLQQTGELKGYDAYDGAPYSETTSEGRVKFLDLTLPQYGLPVYDWVISLEVAEHIPRHFERIFIDNIARHAKEGVILSWAVPGQEGYSHVNNRPFEYVKKLMESLGFEHEHAESMKLKTSAKLPWLRGNTNVYRRKNINDSVVNMEINA